MAVTRRQLKWICDLLGVDQNQVMEITIEPTEVTIQKFIERDVRGFHTTTEVHPVVEKLNPAEPSP